MKTEFTPADSGQAFRTADGRRGRLEFPPIRPSGFQYDPRVAILWLEGSWLYVWPEDVERVGAGF